MKSNFYHLKNSEQSIVFCQKKKNVPSLIYWGEKLSANVSELLNLTLEEDPILFAGVDESLSLNLYPEVSKGWIDRPPLIGYNGHYHSISSNWKLMAIEKKKLAKSKKIVFCLKDQQLYLDFIFEFFSTGILTVGLCLKNHFLQELKIEYLSNPIIPIPENHTKIKYWSGKWCGEFSPRMVNWFRGELALVNRTGRTSHELFPGILSATDGFNENQGEVLLGHLAWSGNWFIHLENNSYNHKVLHSGIHYLPNEKRLLPGEELKTPLLYLTKSQQGVNKASNSFHQLIRNNFLKSSQIRRVHFNTWEAIYFNHDLEKIKALVARASQLGVERFILDDGWFKGRNNDQSSLGDWEVDRKKYLADPDQFLEIIKLVEKSNMDFGLWVEPEMINPDSTLYRKHPDWFLGKQQPLTIRNQLVLNLNIPEAYEYIVTCLEKLLSKYPIAYLKWDMNRYYLETVPVRRSKFSTNKMDTTINTPLAEKQVIALYQILARLKKKYPLLDIESCASGGGRIDLGILEYVYRFWLSDHNDALDRLTMHREASFFFPPEVFGSHIHPSPSHTSGRQLNYHFIAFMAATTGHLGLELDLTQLSPADLTLIKEAVSFYKKNRGFLQQANFFRLEVTGNEFIANFFSNEKKFFLLLYQVKTLRNKMAPKLFIPHLPASKIYRMRVLHYFEKYAPAVRQQFTQLPQKSLRVSGIGLKKSGFRLPNGWPNQVWVFLGEEA